MLTWRTLATFSTVAALGLTTALAEDEPARRRGGGAVGPAGAAVHGGQVHKTKTHSFEVLLGDGYVRVYICDKTDKPLSAKGASGTLDIGMIRRQEVGRRRASHQGTSTRLRYVAKNKKKGRLRSYLEAKHSLGKVKREAARVDVTLNLPGVKGKTEFRVTFRAASPEVTYACTADECEARFLDPGECPKCEVALKREGGQPERPWRPRQGRR